MITIRTFNIEKGNKSLGEVFAMTRTYITDSGITAHTNISTGKPGVMIEGFRFESLEHDADYDITQLTKQLFAEKGLTAKLIKEV